MVYPKLVRKSNCKTDIHVVLYGEETTENGSPVIQLENDFKCNYQDKAKRILTNEKVIIEIIGSALFYEDIAPNLETISSGKATIFGITRDIVKGTKARNPDGSVNYVQLELK